MDRKYEPMLFRGQSARRGNLLPGVARRDPSHDTLELEKALLREFQLLGAQHLSHAARDHSLELLVAAQHYGLETRLLDWTSDPLVALFFACCDGATRDGYVYVFETNGFFEPKAYDMDPFSHPMPVAFRPPRSNARIIAQQGWFTVHTHYEQEGRFPPLEEFPDVNPFIHEWVVPAHRRSSLLLELESRGVSYHSLFPDLQGVSWHLNAKLQRQVPRNPGHGRSDA
ncbi:FRG domain-containing protein [Aquincola sp. S2]|uniref:FRG domain-containing protein n=2 Tax=Pseudaquabacterium terrae TaxID=2732868 RepID=A0ABX2EVF2_9BURK|nr:FRG domain-containing protein [Aquabacterium terrae]